MNAAARSVDIVVRRGETVGIVGESGSGKSTVARCVARLIEPTAGAIRIGEVDVARLPERRLRPHRRNVQIVFQDPYRSLNPRRTVGASIIEGPINFGLPTPEALDRARRLMTLVGLAPDVARPLSAPVLRRPAPAHRHRARARHGAAATDRRRAGLRARRVGASASLEAAR